MPTTTTPRPRRERKPLAPVVITVAHLAYSPTLGRGVCDVIDADGASETYLLDAHRTAGHLDGMRLSKLSDAHVHDVDMTVSPWRCDCGDATHRPDRPGGCRHVRALLLAIEQLRAATTGTSTPA